MLYLVWLSLLHQVTTCSLECDLANGISCIQPHLIQFHLGDIIVDRLKHRFTACQFDQSTHVANKMTLANSNKPSDHPSIMVAVVECEQEVTSWKERSIVNRRRWMYPGCSVDLSLLVVLKNGTLRPYLLQRAPRKITTEADFHVRLSRNYNISSLGALLDELLIKMENHPRAAVYHEQEHHMPIQDAKEHWPNWAIYVVIVCFLLTLFAFLLGNCITKRATPLRFKSTSSKQPAAPVNRRNWGAGFSGGLWAAA